MYTVELGWDGGCVGFLILEYIMTTINTLMEESAFMQSTDT